MGSQQALSRQHIDRVFEGSGLTAQVGRSAIEHVWAEAMEANAATKASFENCMFADL